MSGVMGSVLGLVDSVSVCFTVWESKFDQGLASQCGRTYDLLSRFVSDFVCLLGRQHQRVDWP